MTKGIIQYFRTQLRRPIRLLAYTILILNVLIFVSAIILIRTHTFHANYIYRQLDARLGLTNLLHLPEIIGYQFSSTFTEIQHLSINTTPAVALELEDMRLTALDGAKDFKYVASEIGLDNEYLKAKLRLKGDRDIHYNDPDKISFRVKLKGKNTLMGMKTFSLHKPRARNYLDEWIYLQMMREEGLVTPRYEFVTLTVNGADRGLFVAEEHYTKHLLEKNRKKEGPILKFEGDYDYRKAEIRTFETKTWSRPENLPLRRKAMMLLDGFRKGNLTAVETFDTKKLARFFAVSDLCAARHGAVVKSMRLYYNPITSKLEPIPFDGHRGTNSSQYYLLAQIGLDRIENWIYDYFGPWFREFFNSEERYSKEFYNEYIATLERISKKDYLDQFFANNDEDIEHLLKLIYSELPTHDNVFSYGPFPYYFDKNSYYKDQTRIQQYLEKPKLLAKLVEVQDSLIVLDIQNNHTALPYEIISIAYKKKVGLSLDSNKIMVVKRSLSKGREFKRFTFNIGELTKEELYGKKQLKVNFKHPGSSIIHSALVELSSETDLNEIANDLVRSKPNMEDFVFIDLDSDERTATIHTGTYFLDKSLIIPENYKFVIEKGVTLNMLNRSLILSYGTLDWVGTEDDPITITTQLDERAQGVVVMDARGKSRLVYVYFNNLSNPDIADWSLPGSVTFYQSDVEMRHVTIDNNDSEDGLNIVRSNFIIDGCTIKNTRSDGVDVDFGQGELTNSFFTHIGNDAIDISGTVINVSNVHINQVRDKGLSSGEESIVSGGNIDLKNAEIGITSKDNSRVTLSDVRLEACKLAFAVFQKKSEYAPAVLTISNGKLVNISREHAIEVNSTLSLNGEMIVGDVENVVSLLNGNEFGSLTVK